MSKPGAAWKRVEPVNGYSRLEVLRILHINNPQLQAWERVGLIAPVETYSFQHLVQLRKLRDLRAMRMSVSNIQAVLGAMRSVSGMANPLLEATTVWSGSKLYFRYAGGMVEPIARQFVLDFDNDPLPHEVRGPYPSTGTDHTSGPRGAANRNRVHPHAANAEAFLNGMFSEAVQLEGASKIAEAVETYGRILAADPGHAPACINLGTILYNQGKFLRAEELYRRATESDPCYALAFFDLGNALDELQRLPAAVEAYSAAIRLVPGYADAHYNLALAFERTGERRKALRHWTAYLKLDPVGPWANHARGQARKILDREKLAIVHSGPRPASIRTARPASLLRLAAPTAV